MAPPRTRFTLIDGLRGIAASAVMVYHYCNGDMRPYLARLIPANALFAARKGWLGVQVFFVLSGFVIAYAIGRREMTAGGAARFALRRQVRLDPPYWFAIALSCAWLWGWKLSLGDNRWTPSWSEVGAHVLYLQGILRLRPIQPVFWTLAIEVQFYLVFVTLLAALRRAPSLAPWALIGSGVVSLDLAMRWRVPTWWFVHHWYMFALGALTWWRLDRRVHPVVHALFVAWVGAAAWRYGRLEPAAAFVTALVITVAGVRGQLGRWLDWRPLQFLGAVSYGIYLLHPLTGAQTRWVLGAVMGSWRTPLGALTVVLLSCVATVGCAWLLHVAVEEPSMRLASRIRWAAPSREGQRESAS